MRDVDREAAPAPDASTETSTSDLRGSVLDVVRTLRDEGDWDAVLEIVSQLVAENADMSRRLAQVKSRFKTSEKIGRAQLVLFVDALHRGEGEPEADEAEADGPDELDEADAKLRAASGIDDKKDDGDLAKLKTRPPRQPANRTAAPDHLRRVDNPILVPASRRGCPRCGADRTCIGHDITEVIELVPAEVVVRRDLREKLACSTCEAEVVRAPTGEKVGRPDARSDDRATDDDCHAARDGARAHGRAISAWTPRPDDAGSAPTSQREADEAH
jgi:transposase